MANYKFLMNAHIFNDCICSESSTHIVEEIEKPRAAAGAATFQSAYSGLESKGHVCMYHRQQSFKLYNNIAHYSVFIFIKCS